MTRRHRIPGTTPRRVLYVLPAITDDAPAEIKNMLAARDACAAEGRCPACGAVGLISADTERRGIYHLTFEHKPSCPVVGGEAA